MTDDPIYFDHNATTPIAPEVFGAMEPYLREHFGNPSSGHIYGQRASAAVERARAQVAELIGCSPQEIIFTAGGTESNNLAIRGLAHQMVDRRRIITSQVEHPAVLKPCAVLEEDNWHIFQAPVDRFGVVSVDAVLEKANSEFALLTVMHANNETGTIQPIAELSRIAREKGIYVHTDAAQSVGKIPVNVDDLGVDLLTIAGHKLYAPKGVGALYVKEGTPISPINVGSDHERGLRPGTENVASIVGLGAACKMAASLLQTECMRQKVLLDQLWQELSIGIPGIQLNGHPTERLPNTLNVSVPKISGRAIVSQTTTIAASTGSACNEGDDKVSGVLGVMGLSAVQANGAIRLSIGRSTTQQDVRHAAEALQKSWQELSR